MADGGVGSIFDMEVDSGSKRAADSSDHNFMKYKADVALSAGMIIQVPLLPENLDDKVTDCMNLVVAARDVTTAGRVGMLCFPYELGDAGKSWAPLQLPARVSTRKDFDKGRRHVVKSSMHRLRFSPMIFEEQRGDVKVACLDFSWAKKLGEQSTKPLVLEALRKCFAQAHNLPVAVQDIVNLYGTTFSPQFIRGQRTGAYLYERCWERGGGDDFGMHEAAIAAQTCHASSAGARASLGSMRGWGEVGPT